MPRDHDFLTAFYAIKEASKLVLCLERTNFARR